MDQNSCEGCGNIIYSETLEFRAWFIGLGGRSYFFLSPAFRIEIRKYRRRKFYCSCSWSDLNTSLSSYVYTSNICSDEKRSFSGKRVAQLRYVFPPAGGGRRRTSPRVSICHFCGGPGPCHVLTSFRNPSTLHTWYIGQTKETLDSKVRAQIQVQAAFALLFYIAVSNC